MNSYEKCMWEKIFVDKEGIWGYDVRNIVCGEISLSPIMTEERGGQYSEVFDRISLFI